MKHNVRFAIAMAVASITSSAFAGPACTQRTTIGSWAVRCEGELPVQGGATVAARQLLTCNTTRDGVWTCSGSANLGGTIATQTAAGQAQNNADCTGFIHYEQTFNGYPGPGLDINYV